MAGLLGRLAAVARSRPHDVALTFDERSTTWGELLEQVQRVAGGLRDSGLGHGDRVVLAWYGADVPAFYYGCQWAGCVPVLASHPVLPALETLLETVGAAGLLTGHETPPVTTDHLRLVHNMDRDGMEALYGAPFEPEEPALDAVSAISFTAGTTGFPKAIERTFQNDLWYGIQRVVAYGIRPGDGFLFKMPRNLSAYLGGTRPIVLTASRQVTVPGFDIARILWAVEAHRITHLQLLADQWSALLDAPELERANVSGLRELGVTAGSVPAALRARLRERFPSATSTSVYGTTEAGSIASLNSLSADAESPNCVGLPVPSVEVRIVDAERQPLMGDRIGEIAVRGPAVAQRYLDPDATAMAWTGGWFHTGDAGALDGGGRLYVFDRLRDVFQLNGRTLYPAQLQEALYALPFVREAAVAASPQPGRHGVVAFVSPRRGSTIDVSQVSNALSAHQIASTSVRVVELDKLPRTSVGKLDRGALERLAQEA